MTPESKVVRAVCRVLDEHHIIHWNIGSGNGTTGLPDRMAVLPGSGRLLALEIKRPSGGRVSPKQRWWLDRLNAAGAIALVVTDAEQVRAELRRIDQEVAMETSAMRRKEASDG